MKRVLLGVLLLLWITPSRAEVVLTEVSGQAFLDSQGQPIELIHDSRGLVQGDTEVANHYGPGVAWVDLNRDGWLDLVIGNGLLSNDGTHATGNYLMLNNGDGTFTELADPWGVYDSRGTNGVAAADIDNDGDPDLIFGNYYREAQMLISRGAAYDEYAENYGLNPMFYKINELPPDPIRPETMGVAYGDFDSDGYVDIYVANYLKQRDLLFRSIGGGSFIRTSFVDVTEQGFGFTGVFFDFDNDKDLDIFVANDFGYDFLFENRGRAAGWGFDERARQYKVAGGEDSSFPKSMGMGVAIADFDNNLTLDIYVTNYRLNSLFVNPGRPPEGGIYRFSEEAAARGIEVAAGESSAGLNDWGCDFADMDNDGDLDLLVNAGWIFAPVAAQPFDLPNKFWLNNGPPNYDFTDVSASSGFDYAGRGRGLATADYDRDGDLDVVITNVTYHVPDIGPDATIYTEKALLYRNDQDEGNHWVILALEGGGEHAPGIGCNRDGIGARVYVTAGGLTQMREVQAGSSYLSQNSLEQEFGLGAADTIEKVEVHWICGAEEEFTGITPDRAWRLVEGTGVGSGVPVALSSFLAEATPEGIELRWALVPGASLDEVRVYRAPASQPSGFQELLLPVELEGYLGHALDRGVKPGDSYLYRLELFGEDGQGVESPTIRATADGGGAPSRQVVLGQNYPNPFNPRTSLLYSVPTAMRVNFAIYDVRGRKVRTLVDGRVEAGEHREEWDGKDDAGHEVPAGVYHYRLSTEEGSSVRRMVLVR